MTVLAAASRPRIARTGTRERRKRKLQPNKMHKEKCYQNDMHANYMHMVHATLPRHCKYRDYNGITIKIEYTGLPEHVRLKLNR